MRHYMTGKEDGLTLSTKTGCGVTLDNIRRGDDFVFWHDRKNGVNCPGCLEKIEKVERLQGI